MRADGGLCGIGIFTREINDLPYKREWAVRIDGAVYGIGIFTREINRQNLPYSPTNVTEVCTQTGRCAESG